MSEDNRNFTLSSYEGTLPNTEPAAPRSISIETADKDSAFGRDDVPYNKGGEGHGRACVN